MNAATRDMLDQLEAIKKEGAAIAAGLNEEQFNWHPEPHRWSIAQCLDHLNYGVSVALPAFDRAIAEGRAGGKRSAGPFRYGWFSRKIVASMEPPPKWRMKTPLKKPAEGRFSAAAVLPEFARVRGLLGERVLQSDGLDLARIRTISPVNRLLRLPLGAYFAFILAHDRRHLWQARQVRESPSFGRT